MRVTCSVALTADGYLDDNTPQRLVISTPGDWAAVHALRAECDAILVGAETLRRDNPSLRLRDEVAREKRRAAGLRPDMTKVTLTRSGGLSPDMRFFTVGDADRIVFSETKLKDIEQFAEVIYSDTPISAATVVTALEKRGIRHLLVEGGAQILHMFLQAGVVDTIRVAVNPSLRLGAEKGGASFCFEATDSPHTTEQVDGMEVTTWQLRPDTSAVDLRYLRMAIEASRHCEPAPSCYCVGAVIVTSDGEIFTGYTHETHATHHAEQEAIAKALAAGASLQGASIYSSMEPCSRRASEPESCTQLILRHGFAHVAFAAYEPACFVTCHGAEMLRAAGVDVRYCGELGEAVRLVNAHLV